VKWIDCYFGRDQKTTPFDPKLVMRRHAGNQLVGRIERVQIHGLVAQVILSIGEQKITSIITAQ